jgi:hypothetical protein
VSVACRSIVFYCQKYPVLVVLKARPRTAQLSGTWQPPIPSESLFVIQPKSIGSELR